MTGRALVLSGGPDYAHDFGSTGPELATIASEAGWDARVLDHPDDLAEALADASNVEVLIVNALRWRMLADRYDQWRAEWGYSTTPSLRRAIVDFVSGGGGLVGNHTAPICFDDWPEWGDVLGGSWDWDRSSHPPLGPVTGNIACAHSITDGVASPFVLDDEVYGDMNVRAGVTILATARRTPNDADQPVVWTHSFGRGRVAYCCFGHDVRSLRHEGVRRILDQAIRWAARSTAGKDVS